MSVVRETLSSILCLSQRVSEVKDVVLQVYIDKFRIATTRVFRYKETPEILSVQPDCSFDKCDAFFAFLQTHSLYRALSTLHFLNNDSLLLMLISPSLICSGSRITIEGKNLDSVYRTVIHFKPKESHLKPVSTVRSNLAVFTYYLGLGFIRLNVNNHAFIFILTK